MIKRLMAQVAQWTQLEVIVMAKKRSKGWAWLPSSQQSDPTLDAAVKAGVEAKVQEWIDKVLKLRFIEPPPPDALCNYVIDVTLKWHGSSLFLAKVYACPAPNAISPTFEDRFARMRHAGGGKFDLAYMRHTGQWVELYHGLTIEQCLELIRDDPWFQV
jgi:hypothetical protein